MSIYALLEALRRVLLGIYEKSDALLAKQAIPIFSERFVRAEHRSHSAIRRVPSLGSRRYLAPLPP